VKAIDIETLREQRPDRQERPGEDPGPWRAEERLDVKANAFSETAKSAIEAKGGKAETINR
jgi:hypothetical protein